MKIILSPPGVRPVWLKDDDVVPMRYYADGSVSTDIEYPTPTRACDLSWPDGDRIAIEIPDDHPYALCQKHGFEWRDPAASDAAPPSGSELVTIPAAELAALREAASRAPAVDAIDPDLKEAREIVARWYEKMGVAAEVRRGDCDHWSEVQCALAGLRHGRGIRT